MSWRRDTEGVSGTYEEHLRRCDHIARAAREAGNTPFGALLLGPDGIVLLEQGNVELTERDCTGHAECRLMERAGRVYSRATLWGCTLITTVEPCAMCAGAIYWGNVGRVVYGMSERQLLALTGAHEVNPTLDLPCREVFARGQKAIEVFGPFPGLAVELAEAHAGYWE